MQISKHVSFPCKCPQAMIALHSSRASACSPFFGSPLKINIKLHGNALSCSVSGLFQSVTWLGLKFARTVLALWCTTTVFVREFFSLKDRNDFWKFLQNLSGNSAVEMLRDTP